MAADLADTRPNVMQEVFALARKQCTFLPTAHELLEIYEPALKRQQDADQAAEQRAAEDERQRILAHLALNPEPPDAEFDAAVARLNERLGITRKPAVDRRIDTTPRTSDCPHCGGLLPINIADMRALDPDVLRAIADATEARGAQ